MLSMKPYFSKRRLPFLCRRLLLTCHYIIIVMPRECPWVQSSAYISVRPVCIPILWKANNNLFTKTDGSQNNCFWFVGNILIIISNYTYCCLSLADSLRRDEGETGARIHWDPRMNFKLLLKSWLRNIRQHLVIANWPKTIFGLISKFVGLRQHRCRWSQCSKKKDYSRNSVATLNAFKTRAPGLPFREVNLGGGG